MNANLNIVFSRPPGGVSQEDFNRWYDAHLHEILLVPGFVAARRYRLDPVVIDPETPAWPFLAVFEIDGDPANAIEEQKKMGLSTRESYIKFKEEHQIGPPLPEWWDGVRFASWNCVTLGDRVKRAD